MEHKINRKDISKRFAYIREEIFGDDLKTYAKRIRYTYQHVHKMEHNGTLSINCVLQLAEMGISIDWLLTGTGNPIKNFNFLKKNAKVFQENADNNNISHM
jgi:hypothetical protein